jgi:hypothetical protein
MNRMFLIGLMSAILATAAIAQEATRRHSERHTDAPANLLTGLYFSGTFTSSVTNTSATVMVDGVRNDTGRTRRVRFWLSACRPVASQPHCQETVLLATGDPVDLPPGANPGFSFAMNRAAISDGAYDGLLLEMHAFYETGSPNCEGWCVEATVSLRQPVVFPLPQQGGLNYSDLWWNPGESGWGLTIADHETQLFAVWYTYRHDGSPTWFVMSGGAFSENRRRFTGDAYQTTGAPYNAPFNSRPVTVARVGSFAFDFAPPGLGPGTALFTYEINGISGTKQIQRQPFGSAPAAWGTDLTDLWWDPSESGWGFSIIQRGNNAFAVWYTYDLSGQPIFVVMPGVVFQAASTFTGDLYTTRGPWFGAPFDASQLQVLPFGEGTVDFSAVSPSAAPKIWNPRSGRIKIRTRPGAEPGGVFNKYIKQQRFGYDAPATPPAPCTATYGPWSACGADGFQSRLRIATSPPGCPSEPYEFRVCNQEAPSCTYTYSNWSECQGGARTRQVLSSSPAGCTGTPGPLTEQCTVATPCSYTVGNWSSCVNGTRTRTVTSAPPGCTPNNPPPGSESCTTDTGIARRCVGSFSAVANGAYCGPGSFSGQIRLESTDLRAAGTRPVHVVFNPGFHFCNNSAVEFTDDVPVAFVRDGAGTTVASGRIGDSTYSLTVDFRAPPGADFTGSASLQQFVPGHPEFNGGWSANFACTPAP